jgi:hypothetical protein
MATEIETGIDAPNTRARLVRSTVSKQASPSFPLEALRSRWGVHLSSLIGLQQDNQRVFYFQDWRPLKDVDRTSAVHPANRHLEIASNQRDRKSKSVTELSLGMIRS